MSLEAPLLPEELFRPVKVADHGDYLFVFRYMKLCMKSGEPIALLCIFLRNPVICQKDALVCNPLISVNSAGFFYKLLPNNPILLRYAFQQNWLICSLSVKGRGLGTALAFYLCAEPSCT